MAAEVQEEAVVGEAIGQHVQLGVELAVVEQLLDELGHLAELGTDQRHLSRRQVTAHRTEV